jgi:hypothetical protein
MDVVRQRLIVAREDLDAAHLTFEACQSKIKATIQKGLSHK